MTAILAWFTAQHILTAMAVWASVNAVAGPVVAKVPNVTTWQKVLHTLCAFGPADVTKVIQVWGDIGKAVASLTAVGLFVIGSAGVVACAAKAIPPATAVEEAAIYASQLNMCVQTATSRAQADACRASVEKQWCGKGGQLSSSAGCDSPDGGVR